MEPRAPNPPHPAAAAPTRTAAPAISPKKHSVYGRRRKADGKRQENSKSQIPNPKQIPIFNDPNESAFKVLLFVLVIWSLELGAYLKFGAWNLEFLFISIANLSSVWKFPFLPLAVCRPPYAVVSEL